MFGAFRDHSGGSDNHHNYIKQAISVLLDSEKKKGTYVT